MIETKKMIKAAVNKIRMSAIGLITSVVKNSKTVSVKLADEELRDVSIISPYGVFSLPITGANGQLVINNTNKTVSLIGVEHDNLPIQINPGETLIYNKAGTYIYLKGNTIEINGNLNVNGTISSK